MEHRLATQAAELITELTRYHNINTIGVNGHGETTYARDWSTLIAPLLHRKLPLSITTNLARRYSDEEIAVLAEFRAIAVSLDTADTALLKRMRRKTELGRITGNIDRIRESAATSGTRAPAFSILAGLYYPTALGAVGLAELVIRLAIKRIGFWDLRTYDYDAIGLAPAQRPVALADLDDARLQDCLTEIAAALRLLRGYGVAVDMHADFVPGSGATARTGLRMTTVWPADKTRDCLDPWTYVEFRTSGGIAPCCARPPIGNLNDSSLSDALNGPAIRRLRANLLQGTLDRICARCRQRAVTTPGELQAKVRSLLDAVTAPPDTGIATLRRLLPDATGPARDALQHFLLTARVPDCDARSAEPALQLVPFSAAAFIEANPDIAGHRLDPFSYVCGFGWFERRRLRLRDSAIAEQDDGPKLPFDTELYLRANPDLLRAGVHPLAHYMKHGRFERRRLRERQGQGAANAAVGAGARHAL